MKVLVCGSRDWVDPWPIRDRIRMLPEDATIISGGARGADAIAAGFALERGMPVEIYKPDWRPGGVYDPEAGFKRNLLMLDQKPDLVIAYWKNRSRGTRHTLSHALARGIEVEAWDQNGVLVSAQGLPGRLTDR